MNVQNFLKNAANAGYDWNVNTLSALATQHGYGFSTDELQTAADEMWGDLSEEQLRGVVGGKGSDNGKGNNGNGNGGNTHVNPPPGHSDGDTWAPPPGDVSGNSCFFIRSR